MMEGQRIRVDMRSLFRWTWLWMLIQYASSGGVEDTEARLILDVTDFGAIGDGIQEDTLAIREALSQATLLTRLEEEETFTQRSPSVTVYFPKDRVFVSAPLNLSSNVILHVDGTLRAITNATSGIDFDESWPQLPPLPSYGNSEDNNRYLQYQAFLYASEATNIVIQGEGTIDTQGAWWWDAFRNRPSTLPAGRPNLLQFVNCSNIEITGVTMKDSPFWTIHPVYCTDVHIHHIKIRAPLYAPNVDGIDPDSSRNVLIEFNDVSCGDDHIAIKAGRCGDGSTSIDSINCLTDDHFRLGSYITSNITIRYNIFRTGMGIALGSELSGGIEYVNAYQNIIGLCEHGHDSPERSCGWGHAIHLKTTLTRSGFLRHLQFYDNTIYNNTGFLFLETDYQDNKHKLPPNFPTTKIQNISIRGNSGLGMAVGVTLGCSNYLQCNQIQVKDNWILHGTSANYFCSYVHSYHVENNFPAGLEACMYESMNRTEPLVFSAKTINNE